MFNDKVVLVTGAAQGIGKATAIKFAEHDAKVILVDYNEEKVKEVANLIRETGGKASYFQADVGDYSRAEEIIKHVIKEFGNLDILVNNAGITRDSTLKKMDKNSWDQVINTNLTGVFNYTKFAFENMSINGFGRIINLSSIVGQQGNFGQTNYAAAKAGVIGLTKTVALEGASKGVTANAVAPGFIETDMTKNLPTQTVERLNASIPMKNLGKVEDITDMIIFLSSDSAKYITGQVIGVNGGLNM